MQFIRGTTPSIEITVKTEIDLHQIAQIWITISQQTKIKIDKNINDITSFDYEKNMIFIKLTQDDTLGLKAGDALFQIRALLEDGTALATLGVTVEIADINKDGVITTGE